MSISRLPLITLFIGSTLYTLLTVVSLEITTNGETCSSNALHNVIPWSAGCFYKKSSDNDIIQNQQQLNFEKKMLDRFDTNNGVNTEILWHRLEFHIKHQHHYRVSFQDIHQMYLKYTSSEHIKLERQTAYLGFLWKADLALLAQNTLDEYCNTYIQIAARKGSVIEEFDWRLKHQDIQISLDHCINVLTTR